MTNANALFSDLAAAGTMPFGAKFHKIDLHFHTPASQDARGRNRYNCNPYKVKYPAHQETAVYKEAVKSQQERILKQAQKVASDIVKGFFGAKLSLVAVTDHNSIGTIWPEAESKQVLMDIAAPTWYELIDDEAQKINKAKGDIVLAILPGVEISASGMHMLAIFPPQQPRRKVHFIICDLLHELGFAVEDWGKNPKVGSTSVYTTIDLISKKGGIPIPAHIDGSDQAMLELYRINSGAMQNVLNKKELRAVEIVKPSRFTRRDQKLDMPLGDWLAELRTKEDLSSFAYFQGSDAHDIKSIGKRFTYVKMTKPTFSGLATAIKMPLSRVRISDKYTSSFEGLYVYCVALDSAFSKKRIIRFNRHHNCVTGKKATGKSYVCRMMQAAVNPVTELKTGEHVTLIVEKFTDGVARYYAFIRDGGQGQPTIFELDQSNSLLTEIDRTQAENLKLIPNYYNAEKMEELITSRNRLDTFLNKYFGKPTQIQLRRLNQQFTITDFLSTKNQQLLSFGVKDGSYKLALNINWRTGKQKMNDFFSLNLSRRRTALMCMIIKQSQFGPAIVDAPGAYFDNEDIMRYLVPLISEFKDKQQIILFTNNPLLAVNTDPDNYIVLQSRGTKLNHVNAGFSIDVEEEKPLLLSIIEGSFRSFKKREDRYHNIS